MAHPGQPRWRFSPVFTDAGIGNDPRLLGRKSVHSNHTSSVIGRLGAPRDYKPYDALEKVSSIHFSNARVESEVELHFCIDLILRHLIVVLNCNAPACEIRGISDAP